MMRFGLKLWSTNSLYIADAKKLFEQGNYSYIELFIVPGSFNKHIVEWSSLNIPFVIHAPHWREGVNLAQKDAYDKNLRLIKEALKFADDLKADKVIVHPGIDGDIKETARQLNLISDRRIIVENKPYLGLDKCLICNGATPEDISFVLNETGLGFVLDIGHAICSANAHKTEKNEYLKRFLALNPCLYHLSDGDADAVYDQHSHIGEGNYDIVSILKMVPDHSMITVETIKNSKDSLDDFEEDIKRLKQMVLVGGEK